MTHRTQQATTSVASILAMLGPEATETDARNVQLIIERTYPGVSIDRIPTEAWTWVRTGQGRPPTVVAMSVGATSLMDVYEHMSDSRKAELVTIAKVLSANDHTYATTQPSTLR